MQNVEFKIVKGNKLVIEVDLSQEFGLSKSGKSVVIGSSLGNVNIGNGVMMGLNIYRSAKSVVTK